MREEIYDLTIIGGGPVGIFAVYYGGLRGMRMKVIDSLPHLGGQLNALYPEKFIYDVPGFPKVAAADLVEALEEQAMQFHPTVCLEEKVLDLKTNPLGPVELTTDKSLHLARSVIIACGVGAFVPRKLDVQSVQKLEGRGVHYFVHNKKLFRDKKIMIVGGGDSALDWALELIPIASEVTVIHKLDRWQAHEDTVKKLLASSARVMQRSEVLEVHGEKHVEAVTVINNETGEQSAFDIDHLLLNIGFLTNLGPIRNWGLEIQGNAIAVNSQMETNLPHVYAAGDIVTYPGKLKLIATGTGEAAIAANNAKSALDPNAKFFPGHSSQRYESQKPSVTPVQTDAQ